jgi:hypothetical protein
MQNAYIELSKPSATIQSLTETKTVFFVGL